MHHLFLACATVNPSLHMWLLLAGQAQGREGSASCLPVERLQYAIVSEAFLLQEGQLECVICHVVGKGIGW